MLAHTATHQGRAVVEVIHGQNVAYAPRAFPAVVFTDPEIAWCGLTEQAAKERGLDVRVLRFPHGASGRARTLGDAGGLTKLIADSETGQILGAGIVGPDAGELIAEAVLAVEMGATAGDLALTIHPHPTMSETLMEAAEIFSGQCTHYRAAKKRG
jgi:dihydrolipoamide dehydrogenase